MSVLIRGMEMPKTCNDCYICCEHSMLYLAITDKRSPKCPLVEIPTPHGRLIDADKMDSYMLPTEKQDRKSWFVHSEEYRNAVQHFNHALRLVRENAPTVIEAEEEVWTN